MRISILAQNYQLNDDQILVLRCYPDNELEVMASKIHDMGLQSAFEGHSPEEIRAIMEAKNK